MKLLTAYKGMASCSRIKSTPMKPGLMPGFTMIELLFVVIIMGVLSIMMITRFSKRDPNSEWPAVVHEVNNMVSFARQEAIAHQKTHRLVFISSKTELDQLTIEVESTNPEKPQQVTFKPLDIAYFKSIYTFPKGFRIKAVFKGSVDQLADKANKGRAYCYLINEGLVEDTLVHMSRLPLRDGDVETFASLKMAPFIGRFEYSPELVKPEK